MSWPRSFLLALLLTLAAAPTWAQSLVGQNSTGCTSGSETTCQSSSGIAVSAGDLLIGLASIRSGDVSATLSASDATNGAWTCPAGTTILDTTGSTSVGICYFLSSGAATIQPTFAAGVTVHSIYWSFTAWTGAGTWSFDQGNETTNGSGTSHSHGSITTTGAGVIVTVAGQNPSLTDETPNASFTALTSLNLREYWQYWITSGAQTTTGTYTSVTSHTSSAAIAGIKFTASGGGSAGCRQLTLLGVGGTCS